MGFLSNLFSSEPDLDNLTVDQMIRYTNSLTAWLDAHPIGFNTPEHVKEKIKHKRALLDRAMAVWQRKMSEHAEQQGLPDPFDPVTQDLLAEAVDNSINNIQDYIEFAVSETGMTNEDIQQFSLDFLNQCEKEFLSQGLSGQDAAASALSRLITEKPIPTIKPSSGTHNSNVNAFIKNTAQYEIMPNIGLSECPVGSLNTDFEKLFGGERYEPKLKDFNLKYIVSKENGIEVLIEEERIRTFFFHFSNDGYTDFSGKTDKGIGRDSTIKDVISKYSEPDNIEEDDYSQPSILKKDLEYDRLGITFNFENEQLKTIVVQHSI